MWPKATFGPDCQLYSTKGRDSDEEGLCPMWSKASLETIDRVLVGQRDGRFENHANVLSNHDDRALISDGIKVLVTTEI